MQKQSGNKAELLKSENKNSLFFQKNSMNIKSFSLSFVH